MNVAYSLTKFMGTEKFSWCRESTGNFFPELLIMKAYALCMQRKQQVGECWVHVIFFA
jgi:hypothetical protein